MPEANHMHINSLAMLRGLLSLTHLSFLLVFTLSDFGLENKMFRKKTVQLFPPVTGKLTNNGSPLPGVKLKRSYEFIDVTDDEIHDYTTTDNEGRFSFPELTMQSRHADNPFATNVIWQGIRIESDDPSNAEGDEVYLWSANSRGVTHNAYFVEMLSALNCDLSNSEEVIYVYNSNYPSGVIEYPISSICRWPKRAEIEKRKAADIEEFGELKNWISTEILMD
ncbi:carboxypeptidase-like regulatory domain-containing protein [Vibrio sp. Y29_XK_CS5]|uniref:carboxypeptidase-like regulatory domain-containing protein n=1 Tax=Vibrio sp. Y29_XK_CS5 TaxID=2957762 RepID=UPI0020A39EC7|nr:carboxypeptidase-like regulatory domain-containing protein [Vibrio sp. Y29_XK_CS5]